MLGELQIRNMTSVFRAWDTNGNGVLEQADYQTIVDRFAKGLNLGKNSPEYQKLQSAFMADWNEMKKDADVNNDGTVDLNEWLDATGRSIQTEEGYKTIVLNYPTLMGDLMDTDKDGKITFDEYNVFLYCFALVNESNARICFNKCDLNGDGYITKDELIELGKQFGSSHDPNAPGHWLFGPSTS